MVNKKFYVYHHIRKDNGEIFYVGKGFGSRAASKSGRSKHWRNIVKKYGYEIIIAFSELTEDEAYEIEINEILRLRHSGVRICNVANGGNGGLAGTILSNDHKEKLRKAKVGKKQMPEHAMKSAMAKIGKKQPRSAVEKTREAISKKVINSTGEIFKSATDAARVLSERTGLNCSQGNISMACNGIRNEAYGFSWSYNIEVKPSLKKHLVACSNGMKFNSVTEAAKWVESWRGQCAPSGITNSIFGNHNAYGYKWSYENVVS
jgi:hypothetical protein